MAMIDESDGHRYDEELNSIMKENDDIKAEIDTLIVCEKDIKYCLGKIDETCIEKHRKDFIIFQKEYNELMEFYFENLNNIEDTIYWIEAKYNELKENKN